jgi:hypothetical protein
MWPLVLNPDVAPAVAPVPLMWPLVLSHFVFSYDMLNPACQLPAVVPVPLMWPLVPPTFCIQLYHAQSLVSAPCCRPCSTAVALVPPHFVFSYDMLNPACQLPAAAFPNKLNMKTFLGGRPAPPTASRNISATFCTCLKGKVPRDLGTKVPFINQLHSAIFPERTSFNFSSCLVLDKTYFFLLYIHMHTSTKSKMY